MVLMALRFMLPKSYVPWVEGSGTLRGTLLPFWGLEGFGWHLYSFLGICRRVKLDSVLCRSRGTSASRPLVDARASRGHSEARNA